MILLQKPLSRKLHTRPAAHRFRADLVITLHPDGIVELRECRSREHPVRLDLALLYAKSRVAEAEATHIRSRGGPKQRPAPRRPRGSQHHRPPK